MDRVRRACDDLFFFVPDSSDVFGGEEISKAHEIFGELGGRRC
jgi:hypothetical protein